VMHGIGVGQVAADLTHSQRLQRRVVAAVEAQHLVPTRDQPATQRLAEETATAGDQDLHARSFNCAEAHSASFSRPILALWRISTGNARCCRKWPMPASAGCVVASARSAVSTTRGSLPGSSS